MIQRFKSILVPLIRIQVLAVVKVVSTTAVNEVPKAQVGFCIVPNTLVACIVEGTGNSAASLSVCVLVARAVERVGREGEQGKKGNGSVRRFHFCVGDL